MKHEKHPERRRVRASLRPFLLPSAQALPERTGQHGCGPASASAPRRAAPARGGEAGMNLRLGPRARASNILPAGGLSLRLGPRARAPALRPDPTAAACDRPARRENGVSPRPKLPSKAPRLIRVRSLRHLPRAGRACREASQGGNGRSGKSCPGGDIFHSCLSGIPGPVRLAGGCRAPFQRCARRGCRTLFSPAPFRTGRESGADRRKLRPERARGLFANKKKKQNGADL